MKNDEFLQKLLGVTFLASTNFESDSQSQASLVSKNLLISSLGFQLCQEVYDRVSGRNEIEQEKAALILRVANYVKNNPRASEQEKVNFLRREFDNFGETLKKIL